jgi:predicted  nucleic acid-binding Zn-ribbon protein
MTLIKRLRNMRQATTDEAATLIESQQKESEDAHRTIKSLTEQLFSAQKEIVDLQLYAHYKDETATTFMNQVKKLQKEIEELKKENGDLRERLTNIKKDNLAQHLDAAMQETKSK